MAEHDEVGVVQEAAALARSRWLRVAGTGDVSSWLDQMQAGELPTGWPPGHAAAVAELLAALGERARHTRAVAGPIHEGKPQIYGDHEFVAATHHRLPMNRKERYFTGTVLPALVSDNGFAHLHRFLALCGLDVDVQDDNNPLDGRQDIEFFTEYGFAESVYTDEDKIRFADRPHERDTPDIVIVGADWLVAVEAKMYHRPTSQGLEAQLAGQRPIIEYWTRKLKFNREQVRHVLLLPDALAQARQPLSVPVVTWEEVRDAYGAVGAPYWLAVLGSALERYGELASAEPTFHKNADALISGEAIVTKHASGSLRYAWVGRSGGLKGKGLADDTISGGWRERLYEVRVDPLAGNPNWFPISKFIAATTSN